LKVRRRVKLKVGRLEVQALTFIPNLGFIALAKAIRTLAKY